MGKKRLVISLLLTIFFVFLLQPFYSTGNLLTSFLATKNHKLYRMDVFASGASTNKVELVSHTPNAVFQSPNWFKNPKWRKDKGNGSVIHGALKSKWQDSLIKLKVKGDGKLFISLRGEDKRINGKRYPVLVDYKKLVVNGKPVLLGRKTIWHDRPFNYSLPVKNGDVVTLEVTARTHHFRWSDLRYVYDVNFKILFTVFILSFLFSYKFVQYVARFKILEHHSRIDIVFLCAFFALLFVPMLKINPADKSLQENRMLAKYPALFVSNGLNLKFGSLFEKWFNDRFWGREWLLNLFTYINYGLNNYLRNNVAFFNTDTKWAFLNNGFKRPDISEKKQQEIISSLKKVYQFARIHNIKLYMLLVPEKNDIYREFSHPYHYLDIRFIKVITRLQKELPFPVVFPYQELKLAKDENFVFFKTEHHWTEWGAYVGYQSLMDIIKKDIPNIHIVQETDYNIFYDLKVRGDWERNFAMGQTLNTLNLKSFSQARLLDVLYKYYTPKSKLKLTIQDVDFYRTKSFVNLDSQTLRGIITGTSMSENLLQFLPYSFHQLKYFRLNNVKKVSHRDTFRLLSRYQHDIVKFQPDVLILCFTVDNLPYLLELAKV